MPNTSVYGDFTTKEYLMLLAPDPAILDYIEKQYVENAITAEGETGLFYYNKNLSEDTDIHRIYNII